jgi:penicillin-binding protein 1A
MFKFLYWCLKLLVICLVLSVTIGVYLIYHYSRDLPDYSQLRNYHPPSVTRVYSSDGKLIEEYALEHRIFVPINSIPRSLIEAFVAAEDKNFFHHPGFDIIGIIRASISNISNILYHRRMEGASTITQQVIRSFLLTSERSLERKIKEAILAYMISQSFTKEQVLELYLNQIFLGKGAYGVAMAAQNYFNKSIEELNLAESALIAGLPKSPSNLNPEKNYNKAKERRDYVIVRMQEDGYITAEVAREAIKTPIISQPKRDNTEIVSADYYAQQVREDVIEMCGKDDFYTAGLTIITSLDTKMQDFARDSLRKGIREYDRKHGFRGAITNIDISNWQEELSKISRPQSILEYKLAVILDLSEKQAKIGLANGDTSKILLSDMKWAKPNLTNPKTFLKKGDVVVVEPIKTGYALRQIPEVNGAIMVMNPITGQVLAAEGGYDFNASKFDRTTQALRQPGSLSKTFVYISALENGIHPNRIFEDGPITISQGLGMAPWKPKNYKGDFLGPITMRTGLEKSRNLVTVRVAQAVGLGKVAEIIKRFGINDEPKQLYSMVLGSIETTLERMTNAYAIIANSGKKVSPHFIELIKDRNGKVIYRRDDRPFAYSVVDDDQLQRNIIPSLPKSDSQVIIDEATNYQITSLLVGAATRGTGAASNKLGKIIANKTGTTNDSKDTWSIGFTPRIVVGTYIGYDTPKTLGRTATGSNVALPVLVDFMEKAYKDTPSLSFVVPDSVKLISVDRDTGIPSSGPNTIIEAFKLYEDIDAIEHNEVLDSIDVFKSLSPKQNQYNELY